MRIPLPASLAFTASIDKGAHFEQCGQPVPLARMTLDGVAIHLCPIPQENIVRVIALE